MEKTYSDGLHDAWEAARKLVYFDDDGGIPGDKLDELFGYESIQEIFRYYNASDVAKKIEEYEANPFISDDIVELNLIGVDEKGVVSSTVNDSCYVLWEDGTAGLYNKNALKKTGHCEYLSSDVLIALKRLRTDKNDG